MEVENTKILTIKLEGADIDLFKSGLTKMVADIKRIGLKHTGMTQEEGEMIKDLSDKINE